MINPSGRKSKDIRVSCVSLTTDNFATSKTSSRVRLVTNHNQSRALSIVLCSSRAVMKFPEPKTLRGAMAPMILVSWFFAMAIFEYPIGHPRPLMSLYWSIAHLSLFIVFVILAESEILVESQSSSVSLNSYHIFIIASIMFVIVFLFLGRKTSKNVAASLRKLNTLNEVLSSKYGIPNEYRLTFKHQIIQLIGAFFFIVTMLALNMFWIMYDYQFRTSHCGYLVVGHYIPICMFVVECTFTNFIRYIGKRFQYLNANITRCSPREDNANSFLYGVESDTLLRPTVHEMQTNPHSSRVANKQWMLRLVCDSRKIHQELCSIARTLNDAFGVQILLSMTISSVLITGILYGIYDPSVSSTSVERSISGIMKPLIIVPWLIFYIAKLFCIVRVCSMTTTQAQRMAQLIHRFDKPTTDREVRDEIHAFSLLLMHNPLLFTASGFFTLNYEMIRNLVGTVTTYLVILIQLHSVYDSKSGPTNASSSAITTSC